MAGKPAGAVDASSIGEHRDLVAVPLQTQRRGQTSQPRADHDRPHRERAPLVTRAESAPPSAIVIEAGSTKAPM